MLSSRGCLKQMFGHFDFSEMQNGVILWFFAMAFLSSFLAPEELIWGKKGNRKRMNHIFVVLTAKYRTIGKLNMKTISAYGKMYNSLQRKCRLLCRSKKCSESGNKQLCCCSRTECTTWQSLYFSWNVSEVEKKKSHNINKRKPSMLVLLWRLSCIASWITAF